MKPYRLGAIGLVFDRLDNVLIVQLVDYKKTEWALPGGGQKESDVSLKDTIIRELTEELGVNAKAFHIIGQSSKPIMYDFPGTMVKQGHPLALLYRGQHKELFFVRFLGDPNSISIDRKELSNYAWVPIKNLYKYLLFPGQLLSTETAIKEYRTSFAS